MALAQPILDTAQETLQELYLQHSYVIPDPNIEGKNIHFRNFNPVNKTSRPDEYRGYLLLEGLLNFQNLHQLRVFELRAGVYEDDPNMSDVVKDITTVLGTIPKANSLTRIYLRIQVHGKPPFRRVFEAAKSQKWSALAKQIARVSSGKPLRFELDTDIQNEEGDFLDERDPPDAGQVKDMYDHIEKEIGALRTTKGIHFTFENELNRIFDDDSEDDSHTDDSDSDF